MDEMVVVAQVMIFIACPECGEAERLDFREYDFGMCQGKLDTAMRESAATAKPAGTSPTNKIL